MKNQKKANQKNLKAQKPGNPNRTEQQHNPSRMEPQKQRNQFHQEKLSGQKKK